MEMNNSEDYYTYMYDNRILWESNHLRASKVEIQSLICSVSFLPQHLL